MAGKPELHTAEFAEYLGRLLGRSVGEWDVIILSSGQQARVAGWLAKAGVEGGNLRSALSRQFRPSDIIKGDLGAPTQLLQRPPSETMRLSQRIGDAPSLKIGIDIQLVAELFKGIVDCDLKSSAEMTSIFTLREISYAQSKQSPTDTLTGLYAAKEALRKCDSSLLNAALTDLEILPSPDGRPEFGNYALSISHSGGFAIAVAAAASLPQLTSDEPNMTVHRASQTKTAEHSPEPSAHASEKRSFSWIAGAFVVVGAAAVLAVVAAFFLRP